jgi:hypothetical protein
MLVRAGQIHPSALSSQSGRVVHNGSILLADLASVALTDPTTYPADAKRFERRRYVARDSW